MYIHKIIVVIVILINNTNNDDKRARESVAEISRRSLQPEVIMLDMSYLRLRCSVFRARIVPCGWRTRRTAGRESRCRCARPWRAWTPWLRRTIVE